MSTTNGLAPTPPMGWNSWDCYGTTVREAEVMANANTMSSRLAKYGWQYIVVDIQWYEPAAQAGGYRTNAELIMDGYGRLQPTVNRFPSAANDVGFKALADYVHSKGLKFGIHMMRGIPRRAVHYHLPILNSPHHAQDIANVDDICAWNDDMFGIDVSKPGAQAYYDSIVDLYASWGVDYLKADDMTAPIYHRGEIEALSQAVRRTGRDIVLSLSPGTDLSTEHYAHLSQHAEAWRISNDLWDRWEDVKSQFETCQKWASYASAGCWPDADMLPLGHIGIRAERGDDRQSLLTPDEQITLMTLWIMSRSPLMFGGDLPSMDTFTLRLLTNDEVLAIHRTSCNNRELWRRNNQVVWLADDPGSDDKYLAIFNVNDGESMIEVDLEASYEIRNLWDKVDLGVFHKKFTRHLPRHACNLYRLHPSGGL